MKIIKPIKIGDGMIESSAPSDGFSVWAPEGRDFFSQVSSRDISCQQNKLVFSDTSSPYSVEKIKIVNLPDGAVSNAPEISSLSVHRIYRSEISPNLQWIAIYYQRPITESQVLKLCVVSISTGNILADFNVPGGVKDFAWSADSSFLVYSQRAFAVVVESSGWTSESTDNLEVQLGFDVVIPENLTIIGGDAYFFVTKRYASSGFGNSSLLKLNMSTMAETFSLSGIFGEASDVSYNDEKSLILVARKTVTGISAFDLSFSGSSDVPQGYESTAIRKILSSTDSDEMLIIAQSEQPYARRITKTSYSSIGDLDQIAGDQITDIEYSDDFYCYTPASGGYGLIDRPNDTLVEAVNPSVTEGDIYTYESKNYEVLTDNNDRPDIGVTLDPPSWQDQGPINRLRMFDGKLDTLTVAPDQLVVQITPNAIVNSMALFNVNASTVNIVMTDSTEGIIYDSGEISTRDSSQITGWYQFFFGVRGMKSDFARLDLPPYRNATITLTLNGEGSDVSIGEVVLGRYQTIGIAQYGTSVGIIDFSRKEADIFGNFEILERRFSKRAEYDIKIPTAQNGYAQTELAKLRVTPLVWIGDETKEETVIYGYYRNFEILLEGPSLSDGTITVEGL